MNHTWLTGQGAPRLLIVFAGWGMDARPFRSLAPAGDEDVLLVHDYTSPDAPLDFAELLDRYESTRLLAWSLGVAMAARTCATLGDRFEYKLAINGTARPIDEQYGISEAVFQGTIDQLASGGLAKFQRRMCGTRDVLARFNEVAPERDVEDLKAELVALQQHVQAASTGGSFHDAAIVGRGDRIFPAARQAAYWASIGARHIEIDAPHYPFHLWSAWEDAFDAATGG